MSFLELLRSKWCCLPARCLLFHSHTSWLAHSTGKIVTYQYIYLTHIVYEEVLYPTADLHLVHVGIPVAYIIFTAPEQAKRANANYDAEIIGKFLRKLRDCITATASPDPATTKFTPKIGNFYTSYTYSLSCVYPFSSRL